MSHLAGCSASIFKSRCSQGICRKPGDLGAYLSPWLRRLWDQGLGRYSPSLPPSCMFCQGHLHSLFPPGAQRSPRGGYFAGPVGLLRGPLQPAPRGKQVPHGTPQGQPCPLPTGPVAAPLRRGTWADTGGGRGEHRSQRAPAPPPHRLWFGCRTCVLLGGVYSHPYS